MSHAPNDKSQSSREIPRSPRVAHTTDNSTRAAVASPTRRVRRTRDVHRPDQSQTKTSWVEWYRSVVRTSPAVVFSILFHVVVVLGLGILTITAVQPKPELVLTVSPVDADAPSPEIETIEFDPSEALELTEPDLSTSMPELSELSISELELPAASDATSSTAAESSTANSASSARGSPRPKPSKGSAKDVVQFCGTAATGNQFAFVVDNSSSMAEDGKMLATIDQLLRAVDRMKPQQEFFVVLYSDTAYPMFYPHAATDFMPATKKYKLKLREWLKTIEINGGGRLDRAMNLVFALRPDAIFILGDGTGYGKDEREMLVGFNPRRTCVINTIGLEAGMQGTKNLMEIAQVNNGHFQFLEVHPAFVEMSKRVKFPKNPDGRSWSQRLGP